MVKVNELEKEASSFISVTELPSRFIGKVIDVQVRDVTKNIDGRPTQRKTLVMRVEILAPSQYRGMRTSLSYPRSTWGKLAEILRSLGIEDTDELINQKLIFVKKPPEFWGGMVRYPRYAFDFYAETVPEGEVRPSNQKVKKQKTEEEIVTEEEIEGVLSEI